MAALIQACDNQYIFDDILLFLVPMTTIECFRELHRTLALVNKYFYDKIHNHRPYWQVAYDLTFAPKNIPLSAIHIGPVQSTIECGLQRYSYTNNFTRFNQGYYVYDPNAFDCKRGYVIQIYGRNNNHWRGPRCQNMSHYQIDGLKRNKSRFKDLFKRTARRYIRKYTKKASVRARVLADLKQAKRNLINQQKTVKRLQQEHNKMLLAQKCAYMY